jgi:5'-phosphate synthase pdxT subunit
MSENLKIAVLALQGDFREHRKMLDKLGVESFEVRQASDWMKEKDGLILPGGESTTMLKLLNELGLMEVMKNDLQNGLPVYGTCAGLILLSSNVVGEDRERFATMNITTRRNAYGRQLGSFYTEDFVRGIDHKVPMTFIRAPYIESVGEGVEVLATVDGHIVAAKQGVQLVTSFHPELNEDTSVHKFFLDMIKKNKE